MRCVFGLLAVLGLGAPAAAWEVQSDDQTTILFHQGLAAYHFNPGRAALGPSEAPFALRISCRLIDDDVQYISEVGVDFVTPDHFYSPLIAGPLQDGTGSMEFRADLTPGVAAGPEGAPMRVVHLLTEQGEALYGARLAGAGLVLEELAMVQRDFFNRSLPQDIAAIAGAMQTVDLQLYLGPETLRISLDATGSTAAARGFWEVCGKAGQHFPTGDLPF